MSGAGNGKCGDHQGCPKYGIVLNFSGNGCGYGTNANSSAYTCLCGVPPPCAIPAATGKCCRPPVSCPPPRPNPIRITFKCPTYCTEPPVFIDPCCPPPCAPPTCPSPPKPNGCCGSKKCGCGNYSGY